MGRTPWSQGCGTPATPPTVVTNAASGVTAASANLNGTVTPNGASTAAYFEMGRTTSYGKVVNASSTVAAGAGSTPVMGMLDQTLACGTLYHFRAVGRSVAGGPVSGNDQTFTTTACAGAAGPTAATVAASAITAATATLNGSVTSNGAQTAVTFDYGTTTAYGGAGSPLTALESPLAAGATGAAVSVGLTGLTCNTPYHFRVDASNPNGTANGSDLTFTTTPCTLPASSTAVGSSVNPSIYGQNVVFTATVSGGSGTPTGSVQFQVDGTNLGAPVALAGGVAQASSSALAVGTRVVTAVHGGSAAYAGSTGTLPGGQVVNGNGAAATDVPALGGWGLLALVSTLAAGGAWLARRG